MAEAIPKVPTPGRRHISVNTAAQQRVAPPLPALESIKKFHSSLPNFSATPLVSLDEVAAELGVKRVLVKDETHRLGLPAFKILGASWATYRAIIDKLHLPDDSDLTAVGIAARQNGVHLFAATEGNHGRAVARMAAILGIEVTIFVSERLNLPTRAFIANEGANVEVFAGDYNGAVGAASLKAREYGGLLVQDQAFEDYVQIPKWIVDGYMTLLEEVDEALGDQPATHIVAPVGVGSFAQAVVQHSKSVNGPRKTVLTVEPDTAACLWKSLEAGHPVSVQTQHTIMSGMNCSTLSTSSWPVLSTGVDASVTVSDFEAHEAVQYLKTKGISAGPCGAATLAALKYAASTQSSEIRLTTDSIIVLLCTEGARNYITPTDVSGDNAVKLTQDLVRIDSSNPALSITSGAGEAAIARFIAAWLEHRNIETHWIEPTQGRPSIIGIARGSGGGKSLMFNGHMDTVTLSGYEGNALSGDIIEGAVHGRGSLDMKSGIAASMTALARGKAARLRGDLLLAAVADEENLSMGTEQVLAAGWRADGAIVSEPTNGDVVLAHQGFVWADVSIVGEAAHGSRADVGVDAICKAGHFLVALEAHGARLRGRAGDANGLTGTVHASVVAGGEEASSYPARCRITVERRTIAGETVAGVEAELRAILDGLVASVKDFKYELETTFSRNAFECAADEPLVAVLMSSVEKVTGCAPRVRPELLWTDCALLADSGIPALLYGVEGQGLHAKTEFATVSSIRSVTEVLSDIALQFCE